MRVPKSVIAMIADLRSHLQENLEPPVYVSDRRLVKAIAMLQVKHSPAWPWGSGLGFRFSGSKREDAASWSNGTYTQTSGHVKPSKGHGYLCG